MAKKRREIAFDRIPVTPETKHRLKIFAATHMLKYDEAINRLLDKIEGKKRGGGRG